MAPREPRPIRSEIAWSDADRVVVRGLDLPGEVLGHMGLGAFAFLQLTGRVPTPQETRLFEAIVVTLVEHGLTPSALAARLTYLGAPDALQAAVAAGLSGLGPVFVGSMEGAARMLAEAVAATPEGEPLEPLAARIVAEHREAGRIIPGLGHPVHKPVDPRAPRLFEIAAETGFAGRHCALMQLVGAEAERATGRSLPVNATGAIGAICCELGLPVQVVRGIGVMARAIGLVGHILEESRAPIAAELWRRADEEASAAARAAQEAGAAQVRDAASAPGAAPGSGSGSGT